MTLTKAVAGLMLALSPLPAMAAASQACLSRAQAKSIAMFILPDTVDALRNKCRATLPTDAYLNRTDSSDRFRKNADEHWPQAKEAFGIIAGGDAITDMIGNDGARKLLLSLITDGIAKDVKPKSCAGVDRMLAALAPLPPANMEMLLESFFLLGLGTNESSKTGKFRICPVDADPGMPGATKGPPR